ncbi:hypothetical protein HY450_00300 [Candidatus Pacearchaeota archaeon]|nr:hypothetical protein [Candidatus Pacearchaeota archaeon]
METECIIGAIDVYSEGLKYAEENPKYKVHRFIVGKTEDVLAIYLGRGSEEHLVNRFKIKGEIVSRGTCYLDGGNNLVLKSFTGGWGITERDTQRLSEILAREIKKVGVSVDDVLTY